MNTSEWINKYSIDCRLKYPSKATQENYISSVTSFIFHFKDEKEPKCISTDKIKIWLLSCKNENTRNHKLCAIKSFYQITVRMPIKLDKIPFSKKAQSLPMPLRFEEVELLFNNCENKKHFAIIALLFNCGLRVGEVLNLKPKNIDSKGNVIHIVNGKGLKDRFVPMDEFTLNVLREYFKEYRPIKWMFNGQYSTIEKPTQYVENGTDSGMIQNILGHKKQSTTLIYAKISSARVSKVKSPFSNIKK